MAEVCVPVLPCSMWVGGIEPAIYFYSRHTLCRGIRRCPMMLGDDSCYSVDDADNKAEAYEEFKASHDVPR